jgi:hypothetical protein
MVGDRDGECPEGAVVYELEWQNEYWYGGDTLDELIAAHQWCADQLRAMAAEGAVVLEQPEIGADCGVLLTTDPRVAERYGFVMSEESRALYPADRFDSVEAARAKPDRVLCGKPYSRVRYEGALDGHGGRKQRCPDCEVGAGAFHLIGCRVERCPKCRAPAVTCPCSAAPSDRPELLDRWARMRNIW